MIRFDPMCEIKETVKICEPFKLSILLKCNISNVKTKSFLSYFEYGAAKIFH